MIHKMIRLVLIYNNLCPVIDNESLFYMRIMYIMLNKVLSTVVRGIKGSLTIKET